MFKVLGWMGLYVAAPSVAAWVDSLFFPSADHFVVRPSVAVELFPLAAFGVDFITNPCDRVANDAHWLAFDVSVG